MTGVSVRRHHQCRHDRHLNTYSCKTWRHERTKTHNSGVMRTHAHVRVYMCIHQHNTVACMAVDVD